MATKYDKYVTDRIKNRDKYREEEQEKQYVEALKSKGFTNPNTATIAAYSIINGEAERLKAIRREAEEARRQNVAGNLRSAAMRVNNGGMAGNPTQEKLRKSSLETIMDGLKAKIGNEQKIINEQGRAEDDPARIRAEKELKDLEKRLAGTQEKIASIAPAAGSAVTTGISAYTPEEEAYIQRLQKKLERGQSRKQTIPAVWNQDLKAIQHMRNAPEKAEGDEYIRWLQEGGQIGLYDGKTTNALIAQAGRSDDPLAQYMALDDSQKSGWLRSAGKDLNSIISMRAAKEYNQAHPYATDRDELLEKQNYFTGLRDEAQGALDRMNGNIRIMYRPDDGEEYEIRGRSNPYYQQNPEAINEQFYDALVGPGEYQKRKAEFTDDPEGWEKADQLELQLTEAWDAYEQGRWNDAYRILTGKNNYAEMESQLGYANDQLNTIQGQLNLYDQYDAFMGGYTGAQRESYDPAKDRGFDSLVDYGTPEMPKTRPTYNDPNTKDVHRIYSFINLGKEYNAYIKNAAGGDENAAKIDAAYGKSALMLPEEIEIFNGYYNAGKYQEASAFFNGLSMALNDRYAKYEEIENREMARKYPVLSSFETLLAEQLSGALAIPRTFAGFAGEKAVTDPNSAWYASSRYTEQTQDEIANMIGGEGGKFYLQGMNTLRNLTNAAMVALAGVPASGQAAAGLAMFATQIYQDQTYKYLKETNDYGKAAGMATLDAVLETMEEMLPYEVMLSGGGNIILDILANSTSEALEELTGATVGEAIKGLIAGRQDWEKRKDQIYNEGGYTDDSGNWIALDTSDSNKAMAEAQTQAWKEKGHEIIENTVAGFVGGSMGASYGQVRNYLNTRSTGAQVNSREGGFNTLLTAARGMEENSATRKLAEALYAKQQKGKTISNYQAGQLAQTMYQESGQEIRDVIEGAMTRKVEGELVQEGASDEYAAQAAPIIAQAVTTGKTMKKADIKAIAKEDAGMVLMASYLKGEKNAAESIRKAGGEAAMNANQAVRDVLGEKQAQVNMKKPKEELLKYAPIAKAEELEAAEGARHENGLDAVVDGQVVQVVGRKGDQYTILDENNNERTVNKNDVRAAGENLGLLMEYADRNRNIIDDDTFREIALGMKDNPEIDIDEYLNESARAVINYRTGGEVTNSKLAESTLNALKSTAKRLNDEWDQERTAKAGNQRKATPGKGIVTYKGIKAGTEEWENTAKKAGPLLGNQLRIIGEIGVRLGNEIEIVEREDMPDAFGWQDPETGKIYVNLAAENVKGIKNNRHVLTVTAHELTHWLEQNSPEEYKALRNFVFNNLRNSGMDIASRVMERIDNFRGVMGKEMTVNEALAEIVADACDQVLTNEQVAKQLETESPNLYQKIKTFVKNFIETVRKYAGTIDTSKESRKMMQAGPDALDEMARIWLGARSEALGRQAGNQAEAKEGNVQAETNEREAEINPHGMEINPDYSAHPASEQFSVRQVARAAKLEMIEGDDTLTLYMEDENGKHVKGLDEDKTYVVVDGDKVKITPEMMKSTPVGMMIDMGLSSKKQTLPDGTVTTQKDAALKMFADLMNLCAKYKDHHLIWEIAGSELSETFSAMKSNADPQYRTTVDFGTICAKTQAIVDVLSETMLNRVKTAREHNDVFKGLDRSDVMMVYDKTHNAKLSVPCPVCYVFSRWMGVPSLLGQMNRFQHEYVVTEKDENGQTLYDENGDAVIDWEATQRTAEAYIRRMIDKYGSKEEITKAKQKANDKIRRRENSLPKLQERLAAQQKKLSTEKLTPAKERDLRESIRKTKAAIEQNIRDTDRFFDEIADVEGYNWVTQALGTIDENGNYIVDRNFRITPEEILFDLNRTGEFARYKNNWSYRTTRGAGMGKAIMPYSGAEIGDMINGNAKRWAQDQNPFLLMNRKDAERALANAKKRVRQQNLVGGQRFQSTSDFRPEWGLDYLMSFLEMQALGSKVQMYTKVAEAVDFLGSIGADVNQSIMGSGNGWHLATEEEIRKAKTDKELRSRMGETYDESGVKRTFVMDFSDVTGMDYNTAKANSKKFNNVQMILVGMNDIHIRLAIGNDDIDFVIPWHSSGNSKDVLQQLVSVLKPEKLTESSDYTDFQTDKIKSHEVRQGRKKATIDDRTEAEKGLWDARVKLLSEGAAALTAEERRTLEGNSYTRDLLQRFSEGGEHAGIILPKEQAEQIFPYEYWDKNTTRETADRNGRRFVEYCDALGLVPRFSQFKDDHGYWKLLIDRKMYDNNELNEDGSVKKYGKYREQQVIDVTRASISQLPESTTAKYRTRRGAYEEETQRAIMESTAAVAAKYDAELGYNPYDGKKAEAPAQVPEGAQMSTRDLDGQYMRAARTGDIETMDALVKEVAKRKGFDTSEIAYHGSSYFGFTEFSMDDMQDQVFVAYSKRIAQSYTWDGTEKTISESPAVPTPLMESMAPAEFAEFAKKILKEERGPGKIQSITHMPEKGGKGHSEKYKIEYVPGTEFAPWYGSENRNGMIYSKGTLTALIEKELGGTQEGLYSFYTRPGKQLVVDAEYHEWDEIPFNLYGWEVRGTIDEEYYVPTDWQWDENFDPDAQTDTMFYAGTRDIARWAKAHGYDSVRINNVRDDGGGLSDRDEDELFTEGVAPGDIAVFFNPNDVKSADTITYDDDGSIIPPSERFSDEENDLRFSTREADMEVNHWMMGLTESSLRTEQERMLWKQYKGVRLSWELAKHAIHEQKEQLRKLETKDNQTAKDRFDIKNLQKQIEKWEAKRDEYEEQLLKVTADGGYAAIMYRERNKMENLLNGRTEDEVRQTIDAIQAELDTAAREMAQRNERLKELAEKENVKRIRQQLNSAGLRRIAAKLKENLGSELQNKEIENRLALLALKMKQGKVDSTEIMELADMLVGSMRPAYDDYVLSELRGMTIGLNSSEQETLKNRGMNIRDLQRELTGTGIRVVAGGPNTIDKNWEELTGALPNLDPAANPGDMLWGPDTDHKGLMDLVEDAIRQQKAMGPDSDQVAAMVLEAASDLVPEILTDAKSMQMIRETMEFIAEINQSTEALDNINALFDRLKKKNAHAKATLGVLENKIIDAIEYTNELSKQHDVTAWKRERQALVERLRSEHTQKLLEEQTKYREKIERYKKAQELNADNQAARREIHMNINRMRRLLVAETDSRNIPEHMKSLAREMVGMVLKSDQLNDRKITAIKPKDRADALRMIQAWNDRDGKFTLNDLAQIPDEEIQEVIENALADIEEGIESYTAPAGRDLIENLSNYKKALEQIQDAVEKITNIIEAEQTAVIDGQKRRVEHLAYGVVADLDKSKRKGEWTGFGSKALTAAQRSVIYGNTTPVYFIKNLRNRGMNVLWNGFESAENRKGLLAEEARKHMQALADKYHYASWDHEKKYDVILNGVKVPMKLENMMALYATWTREQQMGPEVSQHMEQGGVYIEDEQENKGAPHREHKTQRARRVKQADIDRIEETLTQEQKDYIRDVVEYLSKDMSELGNEASMAMYGIRKYNEKYYFPMKVWDGVKSARSDRGISGTQENRIAHQGWDKRRKHKARNALIIGKFTDTAVRHIDEMTNYVTFAPVIEGLNKVLNWQEEQLDEDKVTNRRNLRVMFQEAYGKEALRYLEDWMKDLQGGVTQDQRKTLRDRLISMFKKNAVAGSLSVTLQQPLSYIRAAMLVNPKYLAGALSPQYWKGSYQEMMDHSGVAVIKKMGRFDMNFGQSTRDWITPNTNKSAYEKISDVLTKAPEVADTMTWTRMWSAVKMEQHALHPEMDVKSDDFLDLVGKRFNEVMRRTQVYDSTLTKSSNMRSQALSMKLITSFMAEPTLSLNVLADAVMNAKQKGGKATLAKAGATYLLSAVLQAAVKGFMGAGRSPDEKKTAAENVLNKILYNLLSEANPVSLIPGYSDLVEVLKNGELKDDALGVLGKLKSIYTTAQNMLNPEKSKGPWRDVEDTLGQFIQLFSNVPLKNLMRDTRAMYNWATGRKFADRDTSGAVLRYQAEETLMNGDNLLGVINSWLGDAGYKSTSKAYYTRMYGAMAGGNQAEAEGIREYLELAKGQDSKKVQAGLRTAAREDDSKTPAEQSQWMIDNDLLDGTSSITTQYKKGEITREEAEKLYKAASPKMKDDDIFWKLDQIDYEKETGETETGYYYRLRDAITKNKADEIQAAVKKLLAHGITKEKIKDKLSDWKAEYTAGDSAKKIQIRDAITKAYKAAGYTADDANKTIERWNKEAKKAEPEKKDAKDTTGRWGRGNIDLNNRKVVENDDGTISTERSFSVNIDGKEVLLPTVIDGKIVSEEEAIRHYEQTGQYLGKFNTVKEAEEYAEKLHNRQDWYYNK